MDPNSRPEPESLQLSEDIRHLITLPPETANSFTALLELPPNQAVEVLLHSSDPNLANSGPVKREEDEESEPEKRGPGHDCVKRKERENHEVKRTSKKSKSSAAKASVEERKKLPYVQVRARRGQATDSHSLAERARREKINARMKLLQELVPGCSKISGTALVLDEIINHVQSLQRQVELLSMRLASVNPTIDFNLDNILSAESGSLVDSNFPNMIMPVTWPEIQANENSQQQWHLNAIHQPIWGRDDGNGIHNFVTPENSLLTYDSSPNSVLLRSVSELEPIKNGAMMEERKSEGISL